MNEHNVRSSEAWIDQLANAEWTSKLKWENSSFDLIS